MKLSSERFNGDLGKVGRICAVAWCDGVERPSDASSVPAFDERCIA